MEDQQQSNGPAAQPQHEGLTFHETSPNVCSNFDEIINKINEKTTVKELMIEGVDEKTASLILKTYEHGVNEYRRKHYNLRQKYENMCVAVCEKLLIK